MELDLVCCCTYLQIRQMPEKCTKNFRSRPIYGIHVCFYKKPRISVSTESFLKLSNFQYSQFLTSVITFSQQSSGSLPVPLDVAQVPSE